MKIKLPVINKVENDLEIQYQSLSKMNKEMNAYYQGYTGVCFDGEEDGNCNYDCYDCDCSDCDWDCRDYACDCEDYDESRYPYYSKYAIGVHDIYHIIGVRFVGQYSGCYYYRCHKDEYKLGDYVVVPTSSGTKSATVVFVKTYYYSTDLPVKVSILKWAPEKQQPKPPVTPTNTYTSKPVVNNTPSYQKPNYADEGRKEALQTLGYIALFIFGVFILSKIFGC